jgi:hypothetical protein
VPVRIKFHGERSSWPDWDEWNPESETSVYALGQQELDHILSMPRLDKAAIWDMCNPTVLETDFRVGIPFYSVHKTQVGELWKSQYNPGEVSLISSPLSLLCLINATV